jgi:hypothetical protein
VAYSLQFGGKEVDSTAIRNGRASNVIGDLFKTTTSKIRALIARKKKQRMAKRVGTNRCG